MYNTDGFYTQTPHIRANEFVCEILPCVLNTQKQQMLLTEIRKLVHTMEKVTVKIYKTAHVYSEERLQNDLYILVKILMYNVQNIIDADITTVLPCVLNSVLYKQSEIECTSCTTKLSVSRQKLIVILVYSMWYYVHMYPAMYITECLNNIVSTQSFFTETYEIFVDTVRNKIPINLLKGVAFIDDMYPVIRATVGQYNLILQCVADNNNKEPHEFVVSGADLHDFLRVQYLAGNTLCSGYYSVTGLCFQGLLLIPLSSTIFAKDLLRAEETVLKKLCVTYVSAHKMAELAKPFAKLCLVTTGGVKIPYTQAIYEIIRQHGGFSEVKHTQAFAQRRVCVILYYFANFSQIAIAPLYITVKALKQCKNTLYVVNNLEQAKAEDMQKHSKSNTAIYYNGVEIPTAPSDIGFNRAMQ